MSRVNYTKCDICGVQINHSTHLRFKRWLLGGFYLRLRDWGLTAIGLTDMGWRKKHVDLCEECWGEVQEVVSERVGEGKK